MLYMLSTIASMLFVSVVVFGKLAYMANSFQTGGLYVAVRGVGNQQHDRSRTTTLLFSTTEEGAADFAVASSNEENNNNINATVAEQFKIVTCMSTSCSKKRKNCGLDSLATFGAMYSRAKTGCAPSVQVEEGPCLGACKMGPCVAIEHDDFVGSVSLEGMTKNEFADRVFYNVITEEDADRVWSSVENAIRVMQEEDEEEEDGVDA